MKVVITEDNINDLYNLPEGVTELICYNIDLTVLPPLPASLQYLNCEVNEITILPDLTYCNNLEVLICFNDNFSQDMKDILNNEEHLTVQEKIKLLYEKGLMQHFNDFILK